MFNKILLKIRIWYRKRKFGKYTKEYLSIEEYENFYFDPLNKYFIDDMNKQSVFIQNNIVWQKPFLFPSKLTKV